MKTVQNTRQFSHPANWAGWVLIGSDVKLSSKVALMGHALSQLLRSPPKSREAMRVVLHLVSETFLQMDSWLMYLFINIGCFVVLAIIHVMSL